MRLPFQLLLAEKEGHTFHSLVLVGRLVGSEVDVRCTLLNDKGVFISERVASCRGVRGGCGVKGGWWREGRVLV